MDSVRLGHHVRALRLRRRWRQKDLGARAGMSASAVSRIERGRLDEVSVATLRKVTEALEASLDVRIRWNGEGLDRLMDEAHAGLVEGVVQRLKADGWIADVEVSFSIRGERGSIDVLAFHEGTGMVLVTEVKSVVPDSQATLFVLDRKGRLAPEIARQRGWACRGVSRLLVIGDSSTSRRRIDALAATYGSAFPVRGRDVNRWLRAPDRAISGLVFFSDSRRVHGRKATTGVQRVRVVDPAVRRPQTTRTRQGGGNSDEAER